MVRFKYKGCADVIKIKFCLITDLKAVLIMKSKHVVSGTETQTLKIWVSVPEGSKHEDVLIENFSFAFIIGIIEGKSTNLGR